MHTLKVIGFGFALLALCVLTGRLTGSTRNIAAALLIFLPLWLLCAALNLFIGVQNAGYSVVEGALIPDR